MIRIANVLNQYNQIVGGLFFNGPLMVYASEFPIDDPTFVVRFGWESPAQQEGFNTLESAIQYIAYTCELYRIIWAEHLVA